MVDESTISDVKDPLLETLIPKAQSDPAEDPTPYEVQRLQAEPECNTCSAAHSFEEPLNP